MCCAVTPSDRVHAAAGAGCGEEVADDAFEQFQAALCLLCGSGLGEIDQVAALADGIDHGEGELADGRRHRAQPDLDRDVAPLLAQADETRPSIGGPLVLAHTGWGIGIGLALAVAMVLAPRWGLGWFALLLGIVLAVMMVCYVRGARPHRRRADARWPGRSRPGAPPSWPGPP